MAQDVSRIVVETKDYRERNQQTGRYNHVTQTKTTTFYRKESVPKSTHKDNQNLRKFFTSMRFINNPNAYTLAGVGRSFNISGSLVLATAGKVIAVLHKGVNISADIYGSSTGETMIAQNLKNIAGNIVNPIGYIEDATLGVYLQNLQVRRQNIGLEVKRQLTGSIINTNDLGKY